MPRKFHISNLPSIRRMPRYLHYLRRLAEQGHETVSAAYIAERFGFEPIQVRKDLALTGVTGRPRIGFPVGELIEAIVHFLGWDDTRSAVLVGVGSLGRALLGYDGFDAYGIHIVAAFDNDPAVTGQTIGGIRVRPVDELPALARRVPVNIGIITVSTDAAQEVCDLLVDCDFHGIWNFAPASLQAPDHVVVQTVDLAESLGVLSVRLARAFGSSDSPTSGERSPSA